MRRAILRLSSDWLMTVLGLSLEHTVIDARTAFGVSDLEIVIDGPDMPERKEGCELYHIELVDGEVVY